MNSFKKGFLLGVVSLGSLVFGFHWLEPSNLSIDKIQTLPAQDSLKILGSPDSESFNGIDSQNISKKRFNSVVVQKDNQDNSRPKYQLELDLSDSSQSSQVEQDISQLLKSISKNDLPLVKNFIEHFYDKHAAEIFDEEPIDSTWALPKQSELEYSFYIDSPLKDIGTLDSISCRSSYCLVSLQVPSDIHLKHSHYMDWAQPVSIVVGAESSDKSFRSIELYIAREQ